MVVKFCFIEIHFLPMPLLQEWRIDRRVPLSHYPGTVSCMLDMAIVTALELLFVL